MSMLIWTMSGSMILITIVILIVYRLVPKTWPSDNLLINSNYIMAGVHFLLFLGMIWYSFSDDSGWEVFAESEKILEGDLEGTVEEKIKEIRRRIYNRDSTRTVIGSVFGLCALFSILTSLAHIFNALMGNSYTGWIGKGQNPVRWLEYFITSGIIMLCLASVSDIKNDNELLAVFAFTALTNLFGMAIESSKDTAYKWFYMAAGFIPFIIPWWMIIRKYSQYSATFNDIESLFEEEDEIQFGEETVQKETFEENMEAINFIGILLTVILVLYNLFPAIQIGQIIYPDKYRLGEFLFIIASMLSKVTLNVGIFSLGRRPATTSDLNADDEFESDDESDDDTDDESVDEQDQVNLNINVQANTQVDVETEVSG